MIKALFWDIDGTVLDFLAAERNAIRFCFRKFGIFENCPDNVLARYSVINLEHWKRLERGELTKAQVQRERFEQLFAEYGIGFSDIDALNDEYQIRLGDTICFFDNAFELIKSLSCKYKQYAVTNGTYTAQVRKLRRSGLDKVFDDVFISEQIGAEKPSFAYFDEVLKRVGNVRPEEIMIIGDSLTSDMQGGNNAGLVCCWYNPTHAANCTSLRIDYEIANLNEVTDVLNAHTRG